MPASALPSSGVGATESAIPTPQPSRSCQAAVTRAHQGLNASFGPLSQRGLEYDSCYELVPVPLGCDKLYFDISWCTKQEAQEHVRPGYKTLSGTMQRTATRHHPRRTT